MNRLRDTVEFFVAGEPAPQGSKKHIGAGRLIEVSKKVKPWRALVAAAAAQQDTIFDAPVSVTAMFLLKRPQRPKWERHGTRPDVDKLSRALLDGLTGPLLTDDSIVFHLDASKRYAFPHEETGVHINITAW